METIKEQVKYLQEASFQLNSMLYSCIERIQDIDRKIEEINKILEEE